MVTAEPTGVRLAAVTSALPGTPASQQELWDTYFANVYDHDARAARIWSSTGVEHRHGVIDFRTENVAAWGTGARMERFIAEAVPLGAETLSAALAAGGVRADEVGLFAVVSCTGYATPGLDIVLARDLGMSDAVQRLAIGHMGCYAALPGLATVSDFVAARRRPAVLLCCELTSLHVQPRLPRDPSSPGRSAADKVSQIVAHALFADGAASAVVVPDTADDRPGLRIVDTAALTDVSTSRHMLWDVTDHGFRMGLSPRVPDVLAVHIRPMMEDLLSRHGLTVPEVAGWAVHPGGPRILEVIAEQLQLPDGALDASYDILRDNGNCSSATVLMVLENVLLRRPLDDGALVMMLAFGPGLTLYATLLRWHG